MFITTTMLAVAITFALSAVGCSSKPTAASVCEKIQAAGVGNNCREDKPMGLGASASEKASFDLPSVPGQGGQVLRFTNEEAYTMTENVFAGAAILAGPHRYGSRKALVFVQMNDELDVDKGQAVKAIVDGL